jgi:hypothetical protein
LSGERTNEKAGLREQQEPGGSTIAASLAISMVAAAAGPIALRLKRMSGEKWRFPEWDLCGFDTLD